MDLKTKKINQHLSEELIKILGDLLDSITESPKEIIFAGFPVPQLSNVGDYLIAGGIMKLLRHLGIEPIIVRYGEELPDVDLPILIRGAGYGFGSVGMRDIMRWIFKSNGRKIIMSPTSFCKNAQSFHSLIFELANIHVLFRENISREYFEKEMCVRMPTGLAPCPSILLWDEFGPIIPKENVIILHQEFKYRGKKLRYAINSMQEYKKIRWLWNWKDIEKLEKMDYLESIIYAKEFAYERLKNAKMVISNRLHGFIIPTILGIKSVFFKGKFHKNEGYFRAFGHYPNAYFIDDDEGNWEQFEKIMEMK